VAERAGVGLQTVIRRVGTKDGSESRFFKLVKN